MLPFLGTTSTASPPSTNPPPVPPPTAAQANDIKPMDIIYPRPVPTVPKGGPGGSAGILIPIKGGTQTDRYLDLDYVRKLHDKAINATRDAHVHRTLVAAAGVYNDKARGRAAGLEKTVFMTVIAFNHEKKSIGHYKVYFRNFVCFAKHYDIDLVVYILHHALTDVEAEVQSLESLGIRVLTYPDQLFWSLVMQKTSRVMQGNTFAEYKGDFPSFVGYGALAMLVPQLEALSLGYSIIYFDVDIGLVQDPVPYITRGDADFVVSIEQRACPEEYPSSRRMAEKWEELEPNTGVMLVRATPQGVKMYRNWLKRIIKTNVQNDQIVFDRDSRAVQVDVGDHGRRMYSETNFTSSFTPNCNWDTANKTPTKRVTPEAATYCFLSEMMFQNGMISFQCSTKKSTRDDWHVEMVRQVAPVQVGGTGPWLRLPVAVHANYCNAKTKELKVRGLWLLSENHGRGAAGAAANGNRTQLSTTATGPTLEPQPSPAADAPLGGRRWAGTLSGRLGPGEVGVGCRAYNASNVYFASKNWTAEILMIEEWRAGVLNSVLANGTLLKRYGGEEVYLLLRDPPAAAAAAAAAKAKGFSMGENDLAQTNGIVRCLIPDGDTFLGMGYDWDHVKQVPTAVLNRIPIGPNFNSTSTKKKKVKKDKHGFVV